MASGQKLHQLELSVVGVLELVHHDVLETALIAAAYVGPRPEQLQGKHDLIAEVDAAVARHQFLILGIRRGQLALLDGALACFFVVAGGGRLAGQSLDVRLIFVGGDVFVFAAADERDDRPDVTARITERPVMRQRELEQAVAEENDLLGAVEHPEVGLEPHLERVLAQQPVAEGVEGRNFDVGIAVVDQRVDALLHLSGRFVGEGEREDLVGARLALRDEPGDAPSDDRRLAGAGAGDDQERAGIVGDGPALLVVQAVEDPLTRHAVSTIRP